MNVKPLATALLFIWNLNFNFLKELILRIVLLHMEAKTEQSLACEGMYQV